MKRAMILTSCVIAILVLFSQAAFAQSTEFTYQGRLLNGTLPANGSHDFEFSLFDGITGGGQIGTTVSLTAVNVNNGVFSVRIDFGNQFPGANRYLEIRVKESGGTEFTTLTPRQAISSAPYAIKSLSSENATNANSATSANTATTATNSLRLSGVDGRLYVVTGDARLSDARNPLPGSVNYIQNSTAQQLLSNFNVSGSGVVGGTLSGGIVNAATQFNIGGNRVFGVGGSNISVGVESGPATQSSLNNTFFGYRAGSNSLGSFNTFFGSSAGAANIASNNSFFGYAAGFGTTGTDNVFLGYFSGNSNSSGLRNTFVGSSSGFGNTIGSNNTVLGFGTGFGANNLNFATAIGAGAIVSTNNTVVLGRSADRVRVPGNLMVEGQMQSVSTNGITSYYMQAAGTNKGILFESLNANPNAVLWISQYEPATGTTQTRLSINSNGTLSVYGLGTGGTTALCRNTVSSEISSCSSSIRYKTNINPFYSGLALIRRLRPVSFNWKDGGMLDVGLVAEEVNKVEPLLTTTNDKGEVEGVKYDRVGIVLVNAVNEQQAQIESQQKQFDEQKETIKRQQAEIDALKKFVCSQNPTAGLCQPKY
jgi:hypothetical protein